MTAVRPAPLTRAAFAPFGDVIQAGEGGGADINDGTCVRFDDLARVETDSAGAAALSVFRAVPRAFPLRIEMLERHPLGSQAFMPLGARHFVVVVARGAADGKSPDLNSICAFKTAPGQGVNFHRNAWHHPLIALEEFAIFWWRTALARAKTAKYFHFPTGRNLSWRGEKSAAPGGCRRVTLSSRLLPSRRQCFSSRAMERHNAPPRNFPRFPRLW